MIALWMESFEHEKKAPAGEKLGNINLIYSLSSSLFWQFSLANFGYLPPQKLLGIVHAVCVYNFQSLSSILPFSLALCVVATGGQFLKRERIFLCLCVWVCWMKRSIGSKNTLQIAFLYFYYAQPLAGCRLSATGSLSRIERVAMDLYLIQTMYQLQIKLDW
jgi:hypothetical protein